MTKKEWALSLASEGFFIFVLHPLGKTPVHTGWQDAATRDPAVIDQWWSINPEYNIGIYTGKFGDEGGALLVVDVDVEEGKNGFQELLRLELEGWELPRTRSYDTPTGGRHYVYRARASVRQGANVLARGLDIRSRGGYIVACGSVTPDGRYTIHDDYALEYAPQWLVDACEPEQMELYNESDTLP